MNTYKENHSYQYCYSNGLMLSFLSSSFLVLLLPSISLAAPLDNYGLQGQVNSVDQLSDVRPTDWAYQALQSLVERYSDARSLAPDGDAGSHRCISGYPDSTYRGNSTLTRYEFAASLNACLNQITELIASNNNSIQGEDITVIQRLQTDFSTELATLSGRVDNLETRTAVLEDDRFSTTTRLVAEVITAVSDSFGNAVGSDEDESETFFAQRGRLNFESSFTGEDLLRVRLQFGNFFDDDNNSKIALATGTGMTRLNFDDNKVNELSVPHVRYYFPVSDSVSVAVGPVGIGYTDITNTITPALIADDGNGVPSLFGSYNPLFRRGGGGEGNLPGIMFGIPPHVNSSDVREEDDNAYHLEAYYRLRVNDNISVTPGVWAIFNPENNSDNDTQYVGVLRTTFNF